MKEAAIYSANLQPDFQNVNLTLNKDELNVFTSEQVFMRFAFSFEETGTPVTIHASTMDYIHIKGMMSARVLIEKEDQNEKVSFVTTLLPSVSDCIECL